MTADQIYEPEKSPAEKLGIIKLESRFIKSILLGDPSQLERRADDQARPRK